LDASLSSLALVDFPHVNASNNEVSEDGTIEDERIYGKYRKSMITERDIE
jgi:hypothetical protein